MDTAKLVGAICAILAISCGAVAQYATPDDGFNYEVVDPIKTTDVTITELEFKPLDRRASSGGAADSGSNPVGDYQAQFSDAAATGWIASCPTAGSVLGMCSVSGFASADIMAGVGNASVYSGAKSDITYGGALAHAQDERAVAIASANAPVGVGGGVTLFGFGGQFTATVTPDLPGGTTGPLAGADSKGWKPGNSATVVIVTKSFGSISLSGAACAGSISGKAKGSALVVFRQTPADGCD